jgi:hypothetical protein
LRLRGVVKAWRPDVVFSTLVDGNLAAVAATRGLRRRPAVVVRETNSHQARGDLPPWLIKAARWAYQQADHLIALSTGVGMEMQQSYGLLPDAVSVIANPVDVSSACVPGKPCTSRRLGLIPTLRLSRACRMTAVRWSWGWGVCIAKRGLNG